MLPFDIPPLLGFGLCALLIILSGIRLSRYGDIIAEKTGVSKAWVGMILLSSVTSLPELINGISAVTIVKSPDLAVGGIMGSCAFNLLILSILDALVKPMPLSSVVRRGHIITGGFSIIMLSVAVIHILYDEHIPSIAWISASSVVLFLIYLLGLRLIFFHDQKEAEEAQSHAGPHPVKKYEVSLQTAIFRYLLNAAIVVAGTLFLPQFASGVASQFSIAESFIGTLMIAVATSLPELVVSITALRIGSLDIAVGNLFGSNIFNLGILAVYDVFYVDGILLGDANEIHILSAMTAIIMTAVAAIGLTFRPERKTVVLTLDALVIALLYAGLMVALYVIN